MPIDQTHAELVRLQALQADGQITHDDLLQRTAALYRQEKSEIDHDVQFEQRLGVTLRVCAVLGALALIVGIVVFLAPGLVGL